LRQWLANGLARAAAGRLRRRQPEWAEAVLSEHASLSGERDQLGWAFGAWRASLDLSPGGALYPLLLALSLTAMALYQWSADESLTTLGLLGALALMLGFLGPQRFLLSGLLVGAVVSAVNGFEALSGIRPSYELLPRDLLHSLRWIVLVLPAVAASAIGRQLSHRLLD
jgi:hypothetical protein